MDEILQIWWFWTWIGGAKERRGGVTKKLQQILKKLIYSSKIGLSLKLKLHQALYGSSIEYAKFIMI